MSQGFLGNPLFLNSFLSEVNQGNQPKIEDLQRIASALIKMRDEGKSLKTAFGIRKKTGWKGLDITQLSLTELVKSEKWLVYYVFEEYRKKKTYGKALEAVENELFKKNPQQEKEAIRQIERIVSETKKCFDIYALPIKIKQDEIWKFYFSCRKHLITKTILEAITIISVENHCTEWDVCLNLAELYREVVIRKKYVLITTGKYDYPKRHLLETELQPIYELTMSKLIYRPINFIKQ